MNKNILSLILFTSIVTVSAFAELTKSNGVVTDSETGFQWQDDYSDNGNTIKNASWSEAITYCENLSLDGADWRLPNKNELLSLIDYEKSNPAIKEDVFQNISSRDGWSSTTLTYISSFAWFVEFYSGDTLQDLKTDTHDVRCVRAGQ
ncbi:MAG: DUF1566 domain-containing protein [Arcobacter sp.]|nr:DUF1566 domain-containing protein [Arcobacter sp.]